MYRERMDGQTVGSSFVVFLYTHNGFRSLFAMSSPRCSAYVKGNDARYGVKVALRDAATGKVTGRPSVSLLHCIWL